MIEIPESIFDSMWLWVEGAENYLGAEQIGPECQYFLFINGEKILALQQKKRQNFDYVYLSHEDLYKLYCKPDNYTIEF